MIQVAVTIQALPAEVVLANVSSRYRDMKRDEADLLSCNHFFVLLVVAVQLDPE